jgi:type VI secretion system VgrG family protein
MGQTQGIFYDIKDWLREKRFGFSVQGLPDDKFIVVEMQGSESMSRPYSFRLNLVSQDSRINFDSVVEKSATLTIQRERRREPDYKYYGIVTSFEQQRKAGRYTYYTATIEPRLTLLSRYRYSEVYLNQSIKQVIGKVLTDCGLFEGTDFEMRLKESPAIDFICQYEESCLDFISRLMEREGIYYYFENGEGRERMIVVDALIGHTPGAGGLTYRQAAEMETEPGIDSMQSLVCRQRILPKTLKLRNYYYDGTQPHVNAEATISSKGIGSIEIFGEDIRNSDDAVKLAKIRAEEISCREKIFEGESSAVGIRPGLFFTLSSHYRPDFCQKYLPITVVHEGSQSVAGLSGLDRELQGLDRKSSYQNKITAIPENVQYRPERLTPRPIVNGTMSAFVDGPSEAQQYSNLDSKGRYKIWFPFRRRAPQETDLQHQSGDVRFATQNAGPESGMHFPLRKDSEVILSFNGGNPDLPIITAAAPNVQFPNMVTSENYTRNVLKTRGKNLLEMVDTDQQQMIRMMAPVKNTVISIGNQTRVLDNPAGHKTQNNQQGQSSNGPPPPQSSTPAPNSNGPAPENLQLYTEGNTLQKSGGYTRMEAGSVSTADQNETKSPVPGDLMTAVSNDQISWIGRNERHRVRGHVLTEIGPTPPSLSLAPDAASGSYALSAGGNEHHRVAGWSLTEVGPSMVDKAATMLPGQFQIAADHDINLNTPKNFNVKCYEAHISTDSHFVTAGSSWSLTQGETKSMFMGQAFTVNMGALERIFIGTRASVFAALKADVHALKSELNLCEEKNTIYEKKGIVTAMHAGATSIGNWAVDQIVTAIANRYGGIFMVV